MFKPHYSTELVPGSEVSDGLRCAKQSDLAGGNRLVGYHAAYSNDVYPVPERLFPSSGLPTAHRSLISYFAVTSLRYDHPHPSRILSLRTSGVNSSSVMAPSAFLRSV